MGLKILEGSENYTSHVKKYSSPKWCPLNSNNLKIVKV